MNTRIQYIAGALALWLLIFILELVRRRRLQERYALIWVISGVVVLVFAVWRGLLNNLATTLGIAVPTNALFVVVFVFVIALLLHFSLTVTRLSDETKVLAQEVAQLEQRLLDAQGEASGELAAAAADHGAHAPPVGAQDEAQEPEFGQPSQE